MPAVQPISMLSDTLIGTADPDYFQFLSGPVEVWTYAGNDTVQTGDFDDTIQLGEGDDLAETGGGNDVIYADLGNDLIRSGAGQDSVYGGEGNDFISDMFGDENDLLEGGDGNDIIKSGNGNDTIHGGAGNNLIGDTGLSTGDDWIDAGDGNDTIFSGYGNDTIDAGYGDNFIYDGDGDDIISAGKGTDIIDGGAGDDNISGGDGNNELYGGAGNDTITSGSRGGYQWPRQSLTEVHDTEGNNFVECGNAYDRITTGSGSDTIFGGASGDTIKAGGGDDIIHGTNTPDVIDIIGSGNLQDTDYIYGQGGNDVIDNMWFISHPTTNMDYIYDPRTEYYYTGNDGNDRIANFTIHDESTIFNPYMHAHDKIVISLDINDSGIYDYDDLAARISDTTEGALIDLGGGSTILLEGVAAAQLTESKHFENYFEFTGAPFPY